MLIGMETEQQMCFPQSTSESINKQASENKWKKDAKNKSINMTNIKLPPNHIRESWISSFSRKHKQKNLCNFQAPNSIFIFIFRNEKKKLQIIKHDWNSI